MTIGVCIMFLLTTCFLLTTFLVLDRRVDPVSADSAAAVILYSKRIQTYFLWIKILDLCPGSGPRRQKLHGFSRSGSTSLLNTTDKYSVLKLKMVQAEQITDSWNYCLAILLYVFFLWEKELFLKKDPSRIFFFKLL